ncbi:hypothetical protein D9M71_526340 [compost metagenome]
MRIGVVEQVLAAERRRQRQVLRLHETLQVGHRLIVPAATTGNHQRSLGLGQQRLQLTQRLRRRGCFDALRRAGIGHLHQVGQHVFRQGDHHRPGAAADGTLEGLVDQFGNARSIVDLYYPLGHLAEHASVVHFLEGFALDLVAGHLADEQQHRCGVLEGGVHAHRGIGGTRATGNEADARLAGQLAVGLGHVGRSTLLAADDQVDFILHVMQRIEHRQVAFAGHAEGALDTIHPQCVDQHLAATALHFGVAHCCSPSGAAVR